MKLASWWVWAILISLQFQKLRLHSQSFNPIEAGQLPRVAPERIWMVDYDADGFVDLLGSHDLDGFIPKLYRNTNGRFFAPVALPNSILRAGHSLDACWRDENGDGLPDLFARAFDDFGTLVARIYRQNRDHTFAPLPFDLPGGPILWQDLDNDGLLDVLLVQNYQDEALIYWREPTGTYTKGERIFARSAECGDVDNDGDLDMLVNTNFRARLLRNEGGRIFRDVGIECPSAKFFDFNGDGRLDLLAGAGPFGIPSSFIQLNLGGFQFSSNSIPWPRQTLAITAGDFNGDGLADLIPYASSVIWENTGQTFARSDWVISAGYWGAQVADLDNDGDPDIVATDRDSNARFILNPLNNPTNVAVPRDLSALTERNRAIFSWERGDQRSVTYNLRVGTRPGASDILAADALPNGQILVPKIGNISTPTSWRLHNLKTGTYYWSVQAIDWAYRGSAFAAEETFTIKNEGEPPFKPTIAIAPHIVAVEEMPLEIPFSVGPAGQASDLIASVNVSPPELAEAAVTGLGTNRVLHIVPAANAAGAGIITLRVQRAAHEQGFAEIGLTVSPVNDPPIIPQIGPQIGFVDGGVLEIPCPIIDVDSPNLEITASLSEASIVPPVGATQERIYIWMAGAQPGVVVVTIRVSDGQDPATMSFPVFVQPRAFRFTERSAILPQVKMAADFDNDGRTDWVNDNTIQFDRESGLYSLPMERSLGARAFADFDNDSYLDFVEITSQKTRLFRNQAGHGFVAQPANLQMASIRQMEIGDVDHDGDIDLLARGYFEQQNKIWLYFNEGAEFRQSTETIPQSSGPIGLGDLDQDGNLDLVIANGGAPGAVLRGLGDGRFEAASELSATLPIGFAGLVDANGDGRLDAWAYEGTNMVLYKIQNGAFSRASTLPLTVIPSTLNWADFNNDGLTDLLTVAAAGPQKCTLFNNTGEFVFEPRGNPVDDTSAFILNDVDGDASIDLARVSSVSPDYLRNVHSSPNAHPNAPTNLRAIRIANSIRFEWDAAWDFNQRSGLTYNVRAGSRPGASDIVSAASLPSGRRLMAERGNAGSSLFLIITNFTKETCYWSVQAIDNSLAGGPFANERKEMIERPGNLPPTLTASVNPFTGQEDTPGMIQLTVNDDRTPVDLLDLKIVSLDPAKIPVNNARLSGSGAERRLEFTPATNATDSSTIYLRLTDESKAYTDLAITITLLNVNDSPTIGPLTNLFSNGPARPVSATVRVGDVDDPVEDVSLRAVSGDLATLPQGSITITGTGAERTIILDPATLGPAIIPITVIANDPRGASATNQFTLTVTNRVFDLAMEFGTQAAAGLGWADIDNDEDLDFTLSSQKTRFYINNGAGVFSLSSQELFGVNGVAWCDYDNDGQIDLMLQGNAADGEFNTALFKNDSGVFSQKQAIDRRFNGRVEFGDFDNDGQSELVLAGGYSSPLFAEIYKNINGVFTLFGSRFQNTHGVYPMIEDFNNDGWLDLYFNDGSVAPTLPMLFTNLNGGGFLKRKAGWPGLPLAWADFTNDGNPDVVALNESNLVQLYRNENGQFSQYGPPLLEGPIFSASVADYDNDGQIDLYVVKNYPALFRNLGNGQFMQTPISIAVGAYSYWADADNDTDLDLLVTTPNGWGTQLYRNIFDRPNPPPSAPSNLRASNTAAGLLIEWDAATDANQTGGHTYNVAVGTSPGRWDILNPMSDATGWRKIAARGNNSWRLSKLLKNLTNGQTVYYTVQAVDHSFAGSPFAPEQAIRILPPPRLTVRQSGPGEITLRIQGQQNRTYSIESSSDLSSWMEIHSLVAHSDVLDWQFTPGATNQLIRVRVQ